MPKGRKIPESLRLRPCRSLNGPQIFSAGVEFSTIHSKSPANRALLLVSGRGAFEERAATPKRRGICARLASFFRCGGKCHRCDFVALGIKDKGAIVVWIIEIRLLAVVAAIGFIAFLIWELIEKEPIVNLRVSAITDAPRPIASGS